MIQLTKDFAMTADENQYIVGKPVERRGKGMELRNPRYYPTVAQAVSATVNLALRRAVEESEITTLREFIQKQEQLLAELETLIAPLEGGKVRQNVVEAREAAGMGKDPDGEKEA